VAWLRSPECWAVFDASALQGGEAPVFTSSARLHALSLKPDASGLAGEAEALGQTELSLFIDGSLQDAYLNGVRMPASRLIGREVHLLLPGPGKYSFRILRLNDTRAGD
jgi:hypothetical protein